MALDRLLSVHKVDVLEPSVVRGASMTAQRTYVTTRTIECRVMPLNAVSREQLAKLGYQVSHSIESAEDPCLSLNTRLRFRQTVLRVVPPIDFSSQERVWKVFAIAHSDDNESQREIR